MSKESDIEFEKRFNQNTISNSVSKKFIKSVWDRQQKIIDSYKKRTKELLKYIETLYEFEDELEQKNIDLQTALIAVLEDKNSKPVNFDEIVEKCKKYKRP
jgi:hypothetical protein